MTKKNFIALADTIREFNKFNPDQPFTREQLHALAIFCMRQNGNFKADRWLAYIAGECGPNGGAR